MAGTMSIRRQTAADSAIAFIEAHGEEIGTAADQIGIRNSQSSPGGPDRDPDFQILS